MLDVYTLAGAFKPYFDLWMNERKKLGIKSEWLFPKFKDGKWIDEQIDTILLDSWGNTFSKMLEKPFYWHSLRHYFTTKLSMANLPESVIQEIIGWESSDMVRLYDDQTAESQFDKYFGANGIKDVKQSTLTEL